MVHVASTNPVKVEAVRQAVQQTHPHVLSVRGEHCDSRCTNINGDRFVVLTHTWQIA